MTQKKDSTKKLKSISTGNLCNAAQYAAEIVCLRKAEKDNKDSDLQDRWDTIDNYRKEFGVEFPEDMPLDERSKGKLIMEIIGLITIFGVGFALGMYTASQIDKKL